MMRSASSVPFRLTYQISIQIELVTNMFDRSGDKCHLGHRSMAPKSAPREEARLQNPSVQAFSRRHN